MTQSSRDEYTVHLLVGGILLDDALAKQLDALGDVRVRVSRKGLVLSFTGNDTMLRYKEFLEARGLKVQPDAPNRSKRRAPRA